jgi:hypothetical protein
MKPRIANLSIEGFRALRRLRIERLGGVNLVTGKNNTGKSSILEAWPDWAASSPACRRFPRYGVVLFPRTDEQTAVD